MATNQNDTSELGQAIQDVSEKMSLLVREEIELAKTEVSEKAKKLAFGVIVGVAAGVFVVFGLIYLLDALAWLIWEIIEGDVNSPWLGFLIVAVVIFALGAIAGLMAARFFKRGSPPAPKMAIEEAKLIKETVTSEHPAAVQGPREGVRS
ncbi:MAG TPA: phage holin family protein [Solirubrobacteraceae bacterium]|nr:phage holin family protein [Solirubrobacteraceae bacterium]